MQGVPNAPSEHGGGGRRSPNGSRPYSSERPVSHKRPSSFEQQRKRTPDGQRPESTDRPQSGNSQHSGSGSGMRHQRRPSSGRLRRRSKEVSVISRPKKTLTLRMSLVANDSETSRKKEAALAGIRAPSPKTANYKEMQSLPTQYPLPGTGARPGMAVRGVGRPTGQKNATPSRAEIPSLSEKDLKMRGDTAMAESIGAGSPQVRFRQLIKLADELAAAIANDIPTAPEEDEDHSQELEDIGIDENVTRKQLVLEIDGQRKRTLLRRPTLRDGLFESGRTPHAILAENPEEFIRSPVPYSEYDLRILLSGMIDHTRDAPVPNPQRTSVVMQMLCWLLDTLGCEQHLGSALVHELLQTIYAGRPPGSNTLHSGQLNVFPCYYDKVSDLQQEVQQIQKELTSFQARFGFFNETLMKGQAATKLVIKQWDSNLVAMVFKEWKHRVQERKFFERRFRRARMRIWFLGWKDYHRKVRHRRFAREIWHATAVMADMAQQLHKGSVESRRAMRVAMDDSPLEEKASDSATTAPALAEAALEAGAELFEELYGANTDEHVHQIAMKSANRMRSVCRAVFQENALLRQELVALKLQKGMAIGATTLTGTGTQTKATALTTTTTTASSSRRPRPGTQETRSDTFSAITTTTIDEGGVLDDVAAATDTMPTTTSGTTTRIREGRGTSVNSVLANAVSESDISTHPQRMPLRAATTTATLSLASATPTSGSATKPQESPMASVTNRVLAEGRLSPGSMSPTTLLQRRKYEEYCELMDSLIARAAAKHRSEEAMHEEET